MILNLEFAGERQVMAGLTGVLKRIKDLRPLANPWDWRLRRNVERHFRGEGTSKGSWASLSLATQLQRSRMGYPPEHPILVRTGALKRSLVQKGGQHILKKHRKYIEWGTKIPYAFYHQRGTKKMPARKMLLIDANDLSRMIQDAREYMLNKKIFRR